MPIYFRNTPVSAPFMFDSIGNHWIEGGTWDWEKYISVCAVYIFAEEVL